MMNRNVLHIDRDAIGAVSKREFADAMSRMAATVSVLTSCDAGEAHGRTVTAVLSLSAEPPMVLVSVKSDSALATAILSDGGFSLAMLAEGQEMIGDAFAGKVPPRRDFSLVCGANGRLGDRVFSGLRLPLTANWRATFQWRITRFLPGW